MSFENALHLLQQPNNWTDALLPLQRLVFASDMLLCCLGFFPSFLLQPSRKIPATFFDHDVRAASKMSENLQVFRLLLRKYWTP